MSSSEVKSCIASHTPSEKLAQQYRVRKAAQEAATIARQTEEARAACDQARAASDQALATANTAQPICCENDEISKLRAKCMTLERTLTQVLDVLKTFDVGANVHQQAELYSSSFSSS
jgi:multidrug resistance efflux pump